MRYEIVHAPEAIEDVGRHAAGLIGFASEDDWIAFRLENDPRFLARISQARASYRAGLGVKLEDIDFGDPSTAES